MIKKTFQSYWLILEGHRSKAALLIAITALSGLLEGVALVCLVPILNSGLSTLDPSTSLLEIFGLAFHPANQNKMLIISLICFFLLGILSALTKAASEIGMWRIRAVIELSFRDRLEKALLSMNWSRYITFKMGEISKAMTMEGLMIGIGAQSIVQFFGLAMVCAILALIALGLSPKLTLLTLAFGVFAIFISRQFSALTRKYAPRLEKSTTSLAAATEQYFSNLKFVKAFGLTPYADKILSQKQNECSDNFIKTHSVQPIVRFFFEALGIVFISIIVAIAFWVVPSVFGRLIAFLAVFYRIAPRMITIQNAYHQALNNEPWYLSWKKRYDYATQHRDQLTNNKSISIHEYNELRFENVEFLYENRPILKDISFSLPKGNMLALVGESGGGKTTILDLITGLIVPSNGNCLLNGKQIKDIRLDQWRSHIGLVMQNSPIFQTTVLENISMEDPNPDVKRAEESAKLAQVWEVIERLPQKWETVLGHKGANLSQGEAQRLSLARALYRKPWLLILDEATSALDAQSEAYILQALKSIKGSVPILMVSHRLAAVDFADEILFLSGGRIGERGTYSELIGKGEGDFRQMAKLQGIVD